MLDELDKLFHYSRLRRKRTDILQNSKILYALIALRQLNNTGSLSTLRGIYVILKMHNHQATLHQLRGTLEKLETSQLVGSSRVDLQACKLEYSIVSPK